MRKYLVVYEKTKMGYSAYVPDMLGVIATGKNKAITAKNIYETILFHLEGLREEKLALPKSSAESETLVFSL